LSHGAGERGDRGPLAWVAGDPERRVFSPDARRSAARADGAALAKEMAVRLSILSLLVASVLVGCTGETTDGDEVGAQAPHFELGQTLKIGAYFVDGSMTHPESKSVIYRLSVRTDPKLVTQSRYFDGVDLLGLDVYASTQAVVNAICDDVRADRINLWTVFGYSRGAFIANKAASLALERCGRPVPPRTKGLAGQYLYGGFVDAVAMSDYLVDANWIPLDTRYDHVHRKDVTSMSWAPVTNFGGGIGSNDAGPDLDHVSMGFSDEVEDKILGEARRRTGLHLFR
jgi:hypothetical protein